MPLFLFLSWFRNWKGGLSLISQSPQHLVLFPEKTKKWKSQWDLQGEHVERFCCAWLWTSLCGQQTLNLADCRYWSQARFDFTVVRFKTDTDISSWQVTVLILTLSTAHGYFSGDLNLHKTSTGFLFSFFDSKSWGIYTLSSLKMGQCWETWTRFPTWLSFRLQRERQHKNCLPYLSLA